MNESLGIFGISPLKTHSLSKKVQEAKVLEKLERSYEKQKETVADVLQSPVLGCSSPGSEREIRTKAADLDHLVGLMKEKLDAGLSSREKIQLMTLAPASWSRQKVSQYFGVSEYIVREARALVEERGIIALPDQKKGSTLSDEVIQSVLAFYEDDEFSRMMPGGKDYVSLGNKVYKQKRLLLCNLDELYAAYKEKFPNHKVGRSKFIELRPKWCVTVSSSGSHSVCVCTHHQNTKLMVDAFCSTVNKHLKRTSKNF